MSLALIQESAKEVRRLAIAGSPLAAGDFRIKKLIAPLEQAGANVPVFAQVAKAISELVNGTEAESAPRLLALSTLVNAILYTQGQTSAAGDFAAIEVFPANCSSTRHTARTLRPLIAALTKSGGGRFEVIKTACESGDLNDLRLAGPAIYALGDSYPEMADLVAEKILPGFGPGIVPRLRVGLDLKGKKEDARKLQVMHQLDPAGTVELCKAALEDGAVDVRVVAVACLGKHEDCLPLVLEQAKSKNKQVRAAALEALAAHDRPEVVKLFGELIKGNVFDILARPFRTVRNRQILRNMLDEGQRVLGELLKWDNEQIPRLMEILKCLEDRKEREVEDFILTCFASDKLAVLRPAKNSTVSGGDVSVELASLLQKIDSYKGREAILARRNTLPPAAFSIVFSSALRMWMPAKVFEEFSPLLKETAGAGKDKSNLIQRVIATAHHDPDSRVGFLPANDVAMGSFLKTVVWDKRWLDAAIQAGQYTVVCYLAKPGHKAALNYLLKGADVQKTWEAALSIHALVRCGYPQVTDFFLELVTKKTKAAKYYDYELQGLLETARKLPVTDLPKLDAFAAKLDEKFVDKYLAALAPLRPIGQSPSV